MTARFWRARRRLGALIRLLSRRTAAVLGLMGTLCAVMLFITGNIRPVMIRDGETLMLRYSFREEPADILEECGIALMAFDAVDYTALAGKVGEIAITRAYPVYLHYEGVTQKLMAAGHTLGALLREQGIAVGPYDELSHSPRYRPEPGDNIVLRRVTLSRETARTAIPFATEYRTSSLLRAGRSQVIAYGVNGILETTVTRRVVDGVIEEQSVLDEHIVRRPVTQTVLLGGPAPVSPLTFDVPLDANGKPVHYKALLENQIATGYSAGQGAWGAGGLGLQAGYVAVRPDEIPYGTRLYITGADGSFVYGFAIAADTGSGLIQNQIDVDLYYDTYAESRLNGRRSVQIYILQ